MDLIKEKVEEIVEKVKNDKDFAKKFKEAPAKALEEVSGIDLPEDKIEMNLKFHEDVILENFTPDEIKTNE